MSIVLWQEDPPVPGKFEGMFWWRMKDGGKPELGRVDGVNWWSVSSGEYEQLWFSPDVKWAGPISAPEDLEELRLAELEKANDRAARDDLKLQFFTVCRENNRLRDKLQDAESKIADLERELAAALERT